MGYLSRWGIHHGIPQPKEKACREKSFHQDFKLGEGHSKSPGSYPAGREVSPKQGSGGQACPKAEPAQTQQRAGVEAHSKPQASTPKLAKPRVRSQSRIRSRSGQSRRRTWTL